jgi:DNA polymerase I
MSPHWLLIDAPYLCHRAFHTTGDMTDGVIFGFLRAVSTLRRDFDSFDHPVRFLFAFEGESKLKREELLPTYKQSRRDRYAAEPLDMRRKRDDMRAQTKRLRDDILPSMGFRNVNVREGYEADDIIAAAAHVVNVPETVTIVSADKDFYQCLRIGVNLYNPATKEMTTEAVADKYNLHRSAWPYVKSLAGCRTDDIPGIRGVSERVAIKYVQGVYNPDAAVYRRIAAEKEAVVTRNRPLVTLPMEGMTGVSFRDDAVTPGTWNGVVDTLKMPSLKGAWV